jgi:hypothetical protein
MGFLKIKLSKVSGRKPTPSQLTEDTVSWNVRDGILSALKVLQSGTKEVVEFIGTAPGTGEAHLRAHQIDSIDDHPPVPDEKKNKWAHSHATTGAIELIDLPEGLDGLTPFIGTNGNWWIGEEDTGVQAEGQPGDPGISPHIGANGNWWVGAIDTGVKAQGDPGDPGTSPHIGANGNWWVGAIDTGVKAQGDPGDPGTSPHIGANGNWWVGAVDTGVKAQGEDGTSAFINIAYASDDQGADFALSWDAPSSVPRTYMAVLVTIVEIITPVAADFAGLWKKVIFPPSELTHFTYIAWRDSPGDGFTLVPNVDLPFEAILVTHQELDPPVEDDFAGLWRSRFTPSFMPDVNDLILPRTLLGATAKGIKTRFFANEAQAFGDVCFINSAGKTQIGNATVIATATIVAMCIDATIAADAEGNYLLIGFVNNTAWAWTTGADVYLSLNGTSGNTLTQNSPFEAVPIVLHTVVQIIGIAKSATSIYFNPQLVQVELKP